MFTITTKQWFESYRSESVAGFSRVELAYTWKLVAGFSRVELAPTWNFVAGFSRAELAPTLKFVANTNSSSYHLVAAVKLDFVKFCTRDDYDAVLTGFVLSVEM